MYYLCWALLSPWPQIASREKVNDSAKKTANVTDKAQAVFTGLLGFSCSFITDLWDRQSLIGPVSRNSWAG